MSGAEYLPSWKKFIFKSAVEFLKKKETLPPDAYRALDDEAKASAFTVAGYTEAEVLQGFLDTLEEAVEQGRSIQEFRQQMNTFLQERGYDAQNPWKLDTIFRTNVQTAYNAGHYKSMTEPTARALRPYWQYMTAADGDVRESHAAMHGRIYRADDPIWDIWYPPNGFRCRCHVVSRTRQWVERNGQTVEHGVPRQVDLSTGEIREAMPDKGFSNNPAKHAWKPKKEGLSDAIWGMYKDRKR